MRYVLVVLFFGSYLFSMHKDNQSIGPRCNTCTVCKKEIPSRLMGAHLTNDHLIEKFELRDRKIWGIVKTPSLLKMQLSYLTDSYPINKTTLNRIFAGFNWQSPEFKEMHQ